MSTREITFTAEERRLLLKWADQKWADADANRMTVSDRLAVVYLEEQQTIEKIQGKLR